VPTATYIRTTKPEEAKAYITKTGAPIVVKASGLCAGKGVIICESVEDGHKAVDEMMMDKVFGASGDEVALLLSLFLCLCTAMSRCLCTCMYTHMHVHTHACCCQNALRTLIDLSICISMHACTCLSVYQCMYVCVMQCVHLTISIYLSIYVRM